VAHHQYQPVTQAAIDQALAPFAGRKGVVLQSLHAIQHTFGYIPPEGVQAVARLLGTSPSLVFGTLTYYADYRTTPPPKHEVFICEGPACIIKGAKQLERACEAYLGIPMGQESSDGLVGFKQEQCYGVCDLAPYIRVDGVIQGNLETRDVARVLEPVTGIPAPEGQREPSYNRRRVF
jgi:NADH:ubiquinone oxidoreductase subunit E